MSDFDAGMRMLHYYFIPPGAFDVNGNLVMPSDFQLPASWSDTVGRVTQSPDWAGLFDVLGVLASPGSDWYCRRVAVSFHDGTLKVIVVRGGTLGPPGSHIALNWSNNLWPRLSSLREYAGRKRLLPKGLADGVSAVAKAVDGSPYWTKPIDDEKAKAARDYRKWQVSTALDLIGHVAEFIGGITTGSKVLATVLWCDPQRGAVPSKDVYWAPLDQLYDGFDQRAIHYWWNSAWNTTTPPAYPFVYSGSVPHKSGVTDVAHEPWELASAIYPSGNWPPSVDAPSAPAQGQPHRICDYDVDPPRCHWGTVDTLVADDLERVEGDGAAAPAPKPADLAALESPAFPGEGPEGMDEPAPAREMLLADGGAVRPLVLAHQLPSDGGTLLGGGYVQEGVWYPNPDDEPSIPRLVWLPSLGLVAEADGSLRGWRPTAAVPEVVAARP
jgi:hypothetical protein